MWSLEITCNIYCWYYSQMAKYFISIVDQTGNKSCGRNDEEGSLLIIHIYAEYKMSTNS